MSNDMPVMVLPPAESEPPSVLQLPAQNVTPNVDGSFTVASRHLPALLAGGWQIAVASGTTHVP
jgi:hypothetical protein